MAAFEYIALDAQGRERKGLIEGDTPKHVRQLLREKHLLPVEIQESTERELKQRRARRFMRRGLSTLDLALLTRQLATLLRSGLPLEESLQAVAEQTEKPRVQRIVLGVRSKVVEGHPLADGLKDFPNAFPEIYRATVSAGEQSGKLDSVLERLSDYTESRQVMGQQVSNALVYPIVLMVLSFAIVSFLLAYVVPQVVAVFESGHQELPFATRFLIALSDMVRLYWYYGVIVTGLAVWAFRRWLRAPEARLRFHRFLLRVPLLGKLIRGVNTARFPLTFSGTALNELAGASFSSCPQPCRRPRRRRMPHRRPRFRSRRSRSATRRCGAPPSPAPAVSRQAPRPLVRGGAATRRRA
jgi:general secretion pathway protein F